ncbi:MAG: glycosyltransferase family 9 protein [Lautropia sp.]|nr:glycosyltransferase family 9 protein [Lautropia sp.]
MPEHISVGAPAASDLPRPLLIRFGAMGDLVLIQPMIRLLSARFGQPVDILAAGGWTRALYEGQPGVGEVRVLANRKLPYWLNADKRALVAWLKHTGPRPIWYGDFDERLLPLLARAGQHVETIARGKQLGMRPGEHLVDFSQRLAEQVPAAFRHLSLPDPLPHQDPHFVVSPAMQADLDGWLASKGWTDKPLLLIQAGNRRTMRTGLRRRVSTNTKWWPEENWAAIIRMLADRHPAARILLIGAPPEADLNEELRRLAGVDQAVNVATELPIPRLLALQSRAAGMISVDTGPGHTAAAVGCPLVVLFGVADPVEIRPRGGNTPVEVIQEHRDGKPDMTAIPVQAVVDAWARLPLSMPGD